LRAHNAAQRIETAQQDGTLYIYIIHININIYNKLYMDIYICIIYILYMSGRNGSLREKKGRYDLGGELGGASPDTPLPGAPRRTQGQGGSMLSASAQAHAPHTFPTCQGGGVGVGWFSPKGEVETREKD
jgi:hypothetical protein